ncbi:hypothetical protein L228DRAFT_268641 [Xylona heveae TC161]|uniref:Zn(2)-C6 fungal-type domain-containing protein n=1 Tax=Xylona heveae (strain CBS 132557 / TC161) TaxID=1328760 RepID=A0A165GGD4_XYLHT|nr:hypothetical protein L228DRAFT_268641 [Xylona heveae TC161]KZF22152.1 hypothetical protein L228DRAFT_268641 [Xylona heveae TC161]
MSGSNGNGNGSGRMSRSHLDNNGDYSGYDSSSAAAFGSPSASFSTHNAAASQTYNQHQPTSPQPRTEPQAHNPLLDEIKDVNDVNEILRKRRKTRDLKACYPCRQRKVKCSNESPCRVCVERGHPELCTIYPRTARGSSATGSTRKSAGTPTANQGVDTRKRGAPEPDRAALSEHETGALGRATESPDRSGSSFITVPRETWDRVCSQLATIEGSITALRQDLTQATNSRPSHPPSVTNSQDGKTEQTHPEGVQALNEATGKTVHLGASSLPAFLMALGKGDGDELGGSILPMLALGDETSAYPFLDLWSGSGYGFDVNELAKALPSDSTCIEFFRLYRDVAYALYPAVPDIETLEAEFTSFLTERARQLSRVEPYDTTGAIYGKSLSWFALLLAVLASGAQCSVLSKKEVLALSQVYICCSFQCLRLTNFLQLPSMEAIQALLIIGNVLSNNMNPGASWALLGMTIRVAQSVGLHIERTSLPPKLQLARRRIWWAVVWQDSFFSISYDRVSSTATLGCNIPLDATSSPGNRSFTESMYRLCQLSIDIVRARMQSPGFHMSLSQLSRYQAEVDDVFADAAPVLRDLTKCRTVKERMQNCAFNIHISYTLSDLCRPALGSKAAQSDEIRAIRTTGIQNLATTVRAFLEMYKTTIYATRSWAAVHRALSSALLLGILEEPKRSPEIKNLLSQMIAVISDLAYAEGYNEDQGNPLGHSSQSLGPLARSLAALRRLNAEKPLTARHPPQRVLHPPQHQHLGGGAAATSAPQPTHHHHHPTSSSSPSFSPIANFPPPNAAATTGTTPILPPPTAMASMPPSTTSAPPPEWIEMDRTQNRTPSDATGSYAPSPLLGLDETSPYSLMDSIIWGDQHIPDSLGMPFTTWQG